MFARTAMLTQRALVRLHLRECGLRRQSDGRKARGLDSRNEFLIYKDNRNFKGVSARLTGKKENDR